MGNMTRDGWLAGPGRGKDDGGVRRPSRPFAAMCIAGIALTTAASSGCQLGGSGADLISVDGPRSVYASGPRRDSRPVAPRRDARSLAASRADLLGRLNALRRADGLFSVRPHAALDRAAQTFAEHLAAAERLDHRADGRRASQRARVAGYVGVRGVWENIGSCRGRREMPPTEACASVWDGWLRSPGHAGNLRAAPARDAGIGVARSARTGGWYLVLLLAAR